MQQHFAFVLPPFFDVASLAVTEVLYRNGSKNRSSSLATLENANSLGIFVDGETVAPFQQAR